MDDDDHETDDEGRAGNSGWPFSSLVGVAPITFLTFALSVWVLNLIRFKWQIDLPADWLLDWMLFIFLPYLCIAGAANNGIVPRVSGPAFIWVTRLMLLANTSAILSFPVFHAWTFGPDHWDCFRDPGIWKEHHPEVGGKVSGYLCDSNLRECVVGVLAEPKSAYKVEMDVLPWYEPHFAVDEEDCRNMVARPFSGEALPAIGRRVVIKRELCTTLRRLPPGTFRVSP